MCPVASLRVVTTGARRAAGIESPLPAACSEEFVSGPLQTVIAVAAEGPVHRRLRLNIIAIGLVATILVTGGYRLGMDSLCFVEHVEAGHLVGDQAVNDPGVLAAEVLKKASYPLAPALLLEVARLIHRLNALCPRRASRLPLSPTLWC